MIIESDNQVDEVLQDTNRPEQTNDIALIEVDKEATPAETEIFLRLLASITKRILMEESEKHIEPKAS